MTDEINEVPDQPLTPGEMLEQARIAKGLSVADLAKRLYVKKADIEAIDNDLLDSQKSLTFIKGYVKNYAKIVGLDVDEISELFDSYHQIEQKTKLQSFSKRVEKEANDNRWMMVTYVIGLLIVAGVAWWLWQQKQLSVSEPEPVPVSTPPSQPEQSQSAFDASIQPSTNRDIYTQAVQELVITSSESAQIDIPANELVASSEQAEDELAVSAPSEPEHIEPAQTEPTQDIDNTTSPISADLVPLVFRFSQDCWVNIIDASGEAIAYGVKKAGRVMEIEGVPPFEVTLGAPHVVSIQYDGETVDMSGFSGNQIGKLVLPLQD